MTTRKRALSVRAGATGALCLALGGSTAVVRAQTSLPPGTTSGPPVPIIVTGTPPFGDTFLQELSAPLFANSTTNTISGVVVSAVYRNGGGTLDFFYQFQFDGATNVEVDNTSMQSFTGVTGVAVAQTSEDIDGAGGLFKAGTSTGSFSSANRPNLNGNGINTTLLTGVTGNQNSFTFVVRTSALTFTDTGSVSVQGGGISSFTSGQATLAPLPVTAPEPGTLALLAAPLAAGGVLLSARRRRTTLV